MKKAKKQAKKIAKEDRPSEIVKNLKETTDNINEISKDQEKQLKDAHLCINSFVNVAKDEDKQTVINIQKQVNDLLNQLKNGGNRNKIIKKLRKLQQTEMDKLK